MFFSTSSYSSFLHIYLFDYPFIHRSIHFCCHSHAQNEVGDENVSLNFWFYDSGFLFEPKVVQWPLSDISLLELCRHIEYLVAEQLGPALVGSFMSWWQGPGAAPKDQLLRDRWRVLRNYLLHQLRKLPKRSCRFVLAMMAPERREALVEVSGFYLTKVGPPNAIQLAF